MEAVQADPSVKPQAVRVVLFDTYCQQYHSLAGFIQKLPLNADMKAKIALFMDTSFLWTKEAFILLEAEANRAELAAVPPVPVDETAAVLDPAIIDE